MKPLPFGIGVDTVLYRRMAPTQASDFIGWPFWHSNMREPKFAPLIRFSLTSVLGILLLCCPPILASQYYDYTVIAQSNPSGAPDAFASLGEYPSIADDGTVAFFGKRNDGAEGIYVGTGPDSLKNITAGNLVGASIFGHAVQINNRHEAVTYSGVATFGSRIYVWDTLSVLSPKLVARGGIASADTFGDVFEFPSINDSGQVVFSARPKNLTTLQLVTPNPPGFYAATFSAFSDLRPMIDNNGRIAVRVPAASTSSVRLYANNLSAFTSLASAGAGYSQLGQSPGVSDNGNVVAFAGARGNGLGVFINFVGLSGIREALSIAGENSVPKAELGQLDATTLLYFNSFDPNSRVAVVHRELGAAGIEDDEVLISFVSTPNLAASNVKVGRQRLTFRASKGIWTVRGFIKRTGGNQLVFVRERIYPVIQVGDSLRPGIDPPLEDVSVYDPLASTTSSASSLCNHYVTFFGTAAGGSKQYVVRGESSDCDQAPIEGGVRFRLNLATESLPVDDNGSLVVKVFADNDNNAQYTDDDPFALAIDARAYVNVENTAIYFTPPPYSQQWPARQDGRRALSIQVASSAGSLAFLNSITYTEHVVECMEAVRDGLKVAYREASVPGALSSSSVKTNGVKAGARAEGILAGVFRRAKPMSAIGGPDERRRLVTLLEGLPWKMRDFINLSRPNDATFSVAVRAITSGQTLHTPIPTRDEDVLLSVGTGSLVLKQNPDIEPGGEVAGGRLYLPVDTFPLAILAGEAHGWQFSLSLDPTKGFVLNDLTATTIRNPAVETVASKISLPSIALDGFPQVSKLYQEHFSHLYIHPNLAVTMQTPEPDQHHPNETITLTEWVAAASFRVPLAGNVHHDNALRSALSCRQTYALSAPFHEFEPAHCMRAGQVYPQLAFSISDPEGIVTAPTTARVEQRLLLNPQDGQGYPPQVNAGLFRDRDEFDWWMTVRIPFVLDIRCAPVPLWWNMFEESENTVPLVQSETIFDTDTADTSYPSPDNIHLHRWHKKDRISDWLCLAPKLEAPGSFQGTFHLHWRWGKSIPGFGGGRVLLPTGQTWVMGLANDSFPEAYDDFRNAMSSPKAAYSSGGRTFLMSSRQVVSVPERQYETFGTGFAYALGTPDGSCANIDFISNYGGYGAGYSALASGFGTSPTARAFQFVQRRGIEAIRLLKALPSNISLFGLPGYVQNKVFQFYPTREDCKASSSIFQSLAASASVSMEYAVVVFSADQLGTNTPFTVNANGLRATFRTSNGTNEFLLSESLFSEYTGLWLAQPADFPGTELVIEFDQPIREIRELPMFIRQTNGTAGLTLRMFFGTSEVGSAHVVCTVPDNGMFLEHLANLAPDVAFDRVVVSSDLPGREFAIGNFIALRTNWIPGDFNYDGKVDGDDFALFGPAYNGTNQSAGMWAAKADLDGDGDVDAQDYNMLAAMLGTNTPACSTYVREAPAVDGAFILSGEHVHFATEAVDLRGGIVNYHWAAARGTLIGANSNQVEWVAPVVTGSSPASASIQLTVTGFGGCATNFIFTRQVLPNIFSNWVATTLGPFRQDARLQEDEDRDGINNFLEWVLGFNPEKKETLRDRLWSEIVEQNGHRYLQLNVIKRKDVTDARLTPGVSTNFTFWESGTNAVDVLPSVDLGGALEKVFYRDKLPLEASPLRFLRLIGSQDASLNIQRTTAGVQVWWPDRGYPMRLESSTNLGVSGWQHFNGSVIPLDGVGRASITNPSSQQFFRLSYP